MKAKDNQFLGYLNNAFEPGGIWEKNNGSKQTALFAYYFDKVITFPDEKFTLLDLGCALGQAADFFSRRYPAASVSATDVSDIAISRAREECGDHIHFYTGGFGSIRSFFDVIYCSNVMEHFHDFKEKTRELTSCCNRLCIMTPYNEHTRKGHTLTPDPNSIMHQITFLEESYDFLINEGLAESVDTRIISCPGAWGWSRRQKITHAIDNFIRRITGRPHIYEFLQIIFDIKMKSKGQSSPSQ